MFSSYKLVFQKDDSLVSVKLVNDKVDEALVTVGIAETTANEAYSTASKAASDIEDYLTYFKARSLKWKMVNKKVG